MDTSCLEELCDIAICNTYAALQNFLNLLALELMHGAPCIAQKVLRATNREEADRDEGDEA